MNKPAFTVQALSEVFRLTFTEEQQRAITAPLDPYVVIAGAGSGKTTVMSARVIWLVANRWIRPDEVLGLTFTNKAASQLATRIRRSLHRLDELGFGGMDGEPAISTYHAYAGALVRST